MFIVFTSCFIVYFIIPPFGLREAVFKFSESNLWDTWQGGFYAYRERGGQIDLEGGRKFASFNSWASLAFLEYMNSTGDTRILNEYVIPGINFMFDYLWNSTNGGIIHWCFQNGSLPLQTDIRFDDAVVQYATYQAWAIRALIKANEFAPNMTYINWIKRIANFLITHLWDSSHGGFYIGYFPNRAAIDDTMKYLWYQTWPCIALYESYVLFLNETYRVVANETLNFIISYFWDEGNLGFYTQTYENGTVASTLKTTTDQGAVLLAITKYLENTGNSSYRDHYLRPTVEFILSHLWNSKTQQFYSECAANGANSSPINSPADISIVVEALLASNCFLDTNLTVIQVSRSAIKTLVSNAWDWKYGGFYRSYDIINKSILVDQKWIIEQVIPLLVLSKAFDVTYKEALGIISTGLITGVLTLVTLALHLTQAHLRGKDKFKEGKN